MPELPDLEVIREFLQPRITGQRIVEARVNRPLIVRNLLPGNVAENLVDRQIVDVRRRGKFLLLPAESGATIVINPMLAGRLRYGEPLARDRKRDALILLLDDGNELRYNDAKDMGKIYLTDDLDQVPAYAGQGPEADDPSLTLAGFGRQLRLARGEVKRALTNQHVLAGIGNAYADEILWRAGIYPMRKRTGLDANEIEALYRATRDVLSEAIATLRERVGSDIHVEVRDFLAVHGKAGQPCPRCGSPISVVTRERRTTHFCRTCQPGLMIDRR